MEVLSEEENSEDPGTPSDQENYMMDSPPPSPIEMKLPPYLPAIEGCRSIDLFSCLNRIEEGTYGVVYRAKDKKTGEINVNGIDINKNINLTLTLQKHTEMQFRSKDEDA